LISGFDPWDVSARALADLIEKEKVSSYRPPQLPLPGAMPSAPLNHFHGFHPRLKLMPPGFTPNGFPPSMANMRHPGKCLSLSVRYMMPLSYVCQISCLFKDAYLLSHRWQRLKSSDMSATFSNQHFLSLSLHWQLFVFSWYEIIHKHRKRLEVAVLNRAWTRDLQKSRCRNCCAILPHQWSIIFFCSFIKTLLPIYVCSLWWQFCSASFTHGCTASTAAAA